MRTSNMSRSVALVSIAGIAATFSLATQAHAQALAWNNAAGGSAGIAANWNPVQVPIATNLLNFGLAGNYAVSFPATVPTSSQMNFNVGTISLSTLSPHTATTQLAIGLNAFTTPTVSLTAGSLSSSIIVVGVGASSNANLNLTGPSADLFSTGANGTRIGSSGVGGMSISNGGSLRSNGAVILSVLAGSQGNLTVTGLNGASRSELVTLDPSAGDLFVAQNGPGSVTIAAGGLVDIADDVFIAPTAAFAGTVTVGSAVATASTLDAIGDLHIGSNLTAAAAGSGTLTINDGATVTIDGTTQLGDSAGGTGTLIVHEGGTLLTQSLVVDSAHGVLSFLGGSIFVRGGTFIAPNNQFVFNGGVGESPQFTLLNGAQCTLTAPAGSRAMILGTTRPAQMSVSTLFSVLNVTSGDIVLGDSLGSNGILQAQNTGSITFPNSGTLIVGNGGNGQLIFGGNGHITGGSTNVGALVGGTGSVTISNAQATLDLAGPLALGGTVSTSGGTATMTIGNATPNSGIVTVNTGFLPGGINTRIWPGSSLTINQGGTLITDQTVFSSGTLTLAGGTIDAGNVVPTGVGPYSFTGTIVGLIQPTGSGVVNLSGPLTVGALRNDGAFNVGDHTLSIIDSHNFTWFLGNCTVGALGHVVAPDGLSLGSGKVFSGDGFLDAALTNAGTITATGSGLALNGIVTGLGQGINGTAIEFGSTGGFTGSGSFGSATNVSALAGSIITATGDLIMGNTASNTGFSSSGMISLSSNFRVSLQDLNGTSIEDVSFVNGDATDPASIHSISGLQVRGVVTGTGTLDAFSVAQAANPNQLSCIGATLTPGDSSTPGTLYLNGDSTFSTANRVEIDIFDATTHDQIRTLSNLVVFPSIHTVPSDITLGGTIVVRVDPGHTPTTGESHQIIATNQGLLGPDGIVFRDFATVVAPPNWIIKYVPTESSGQENGVFAIYCTADFNEDGTVDFFDYLDFVDAFSANDPSADFNTDGVIDFFDYLDFVDAFSVGCDA